MIIHNCKFYQKKKKSRDHPEALDNDSDDDSDNDDNKLTTRFTADGLVQLDKNGVIVGKVGSTKKEDERQKTSAPVLAVGAKVTASYHAKDQYDGDESWFGGTISRVVCDKQGNVVSYDIEYDDGDFEEGVEPQNVRPVDKTADELQKEADLKEQAAVLLRKRQKAKEKARWVTIVRALGLF